MLIGLTGGIASGKSTVAKLLAELGATVIDADKLGHAAYEPGTEAHRQVIETFGPDVEAADGTIDRRALGGKVFGDPDELSKLTAIVWPEIRRLAQEQIAAGLAAAPDAVVVLEAAVMIEAGWYKTMDQVWCVVVEPEVAIERACARDGLEPEAVQQRLDAQLSNAERTAHADVIIDNSKDLAHLEAQVTTAWASVRAQQEQTT